MNRRQVLRALLSTLILAPVPATFVAYTKSQHIVVHPDGLLTLPDAIRLAKAGDTIYLDGGVYDGPLVLPGTDITYVLTNVTVIGGVHGTGHK